MLNRTIYSGLSYLLAPLAVARLYYLSGRHRGYRRNIGHRFGFIDTVSPASDSATKTLWLHAVSVGEVIAAEPFVNGLLSEYPQLRICLTTMTPTGAEQVCRSFSDAVKTGRMTQCYAPYDLPVVVDRFLAHLNPCGLVIMETELWPNWIARAVNRALPAILINGRLSKKSARGYEKIGKLAKEMFASFSCISAQTEEDASRFRALGAKNVMVSGNMKADFELSAFEEKRANELADILGLDNTSNVLIAASTHKGEEGIIFDAFVALRKKYPDLTLLLVPRHPERSFDIAKVADDKNIGYRLRSENVQIDAGHPMIICDQLGELRSLYGLASIVIMGGTFIDHGGHNPLEPAAWSLPIIAGPSQRNFDLVFNALEESGAMLRVEPNKDSLTEVLAHLLGAESATASMGEAALNYLNQSQGATQANLELFDDVIKL